MKLPRFSLPNRNGQLHILQLSAIKRENINLFYRHFGKLTSQFCPICDADIFTALFLFIGDHVFFHGICDLHAAQTFDMTIDKRGIIFTVVLDPELTVFH